MSVRDTSTETYNELKNQGTIGAQELEILLWLKRQPGPVSRRQISRGSRIEINAVSGRINGLVKKGLVKEYDKAPCPITGRNVHPVSVS